MTFPYVPGWGDSVANALPQIGQNIQRIINPQLDQQEALKAAIIKDPELLQRFATIERDNPGTMARMFGRGPMPGIIAGVSPTAEESAVHNFFEDPKNAAAYAQTRALGQNPGQQAATAAQTRLAVASAVESEQTLPAKKKKGELENTALETENAIKDLQKGMATMQYRQSEQQSATFEAAVKAVPNLAKVNIADLANRVSNGTQQPGDNAALTQIMADPHLSQQFENYRNSILERAKLAVEQDRTDLLRHSSRGEQMTAIRLAQAAQKQAQTEYDKMNKLVQDYSRISAKDMGSKRLLAQAKNPDGTPANPQLVQELDTFDKLQANGGQELNNAKDNAVKMSAFVEALYKDDPKLKKAYEAAEALVAKKTGSTTGGTGTPNDSTAKSRGKPIVPDSDVQRVIDAAYDDKVPLGFIKSQTSWSKLTPSQQKQALDSLAAAGIRQ